ncbi:MAG: RNA methyltransferase [Firmicutes bacterium]|nr:RNA methyltransferase [Bacillota bacterium]
MHNIIEITDFNAVELDVFSRLTETQLRNRLEPEKGIFIAESPKVIHVALDMGCKPVALLMERKHISGDGSKVIARCGDVPVYTGSRELLEQLTGYRLTRGVLCAMLRPKRLSLTQVCSNAKRLAVLEGIVDSTNIGAIFRSAAALGMDGILLTSSCCDPLCRRAVRVSMGTVFQIPWARIEDKCSWPDQGILRLKEYGFKTAAMALSNDSVSVDNNDLLTEERLAVILGTEGHGLSKATIAMCDYTVCIPMHYNVDSLNVAAASAVAFWELRARK